MNSPKSYADAQKTVHAEYIPPMSLHRFLRDHRPIQSFSMGLRKTRMAAAHLIANRRYILATDVAEFNRSLASDEFAGSVSNLSVARSIKPKKET